MLGLARDRQAFRRDREQAVGGPSFRVQCQHLALLSPSPYTTSVALEVAGLVAMTGVLRNPQSCLQSKGLDMPRTLKESYLHFV